MKGPDLVALCIATLGAFASVLAAWIAAQVAVRNTLKAAGTSVETNNKTLFVTSITVERAKWRQELRVETAEFVRLCYAGLDGMTNELRWHLHEHRVLISLRVNPDRSHKTDLAILTAVRAIPSLVQLGKKDEVIASLAILETSVQKLLKAEWEKSKTEAITGNLQITNLLTM